MAYILFLIYTRYILLYTKTSTTLLQPVFANVIIVNIDL